MDAKAKAMELVERYLRCEDETLFYWNTYWDERMNDEEVLPHAKKCALIAVEEIRKVHPREYHKIEFWQSVEREIEAL